MDDLIPAFYVNITDSCNMNCEYCPPYGENCESIENLINVVDLENIILVMNEKRIITYRITGGEPMKYPDRVFRIIEFMNSLGIHNIILNTNGFNLYEYVDQLSLFVFSKIKISLDTLVESRFNEITQTKNKFNKVIKSIDSIAMEKIPLELNMVVLKKNSNDLWDLIDFCIKRKISLKVLDLVKYESNRSGIPPDVYFSNSYFNPRRFFPKLIKKYGEPIPLRLSGDRGIPMQQFKLSENSLLTIKDSSRGSTFSTNCKCCKYFPCQEGLFHLSLTASGNLSPCRLRMDLAKDLKGKGIMEIRQIVSDMLYYYKEPFLLAETIKLPK